MDANVTQADGCKDHFLGRRNDTVKSVHNSQGSANEGSKRKIVEYTEDGPVCEDGGDSEEHDGEDAVMQEEDAENSNANATGGDDAGQD